MTGTRFFKLSGAGNDFIALVDPAELPSAATIHSWCRRGVSLGADGLVVLQRTEDGEEAAAIRYFNADGSEAALCLNATRCAAQLAHHLGWGKAPVLLTAAGRLRGRRLDAQNAALEAPLPEPPRALELSVDGETMAGWLVRVGVPHFVVPVAAGLDDVPVAELGPALRRHPHLGAAGANVDFVRYEGANRMSIRSFERGVEGETLACGTGILCAVAAGIVAHELEMPVRVLTRGGFWMTVAGEIQEPDRRVRHWELAGDARVVAEGRLFPEGSPSDRAAG